MSNFVVSTVHADGLALLVARSSAGTVMTKSQSICIYIYIYIYGTSIWKVNVRANCNVMAYVYIQDGSQNRMRAK